MIRMIQVGVGPLGQKIVKHAVERRGIAVVGAVDLDPAKIGHDLGAVCGTGRLGVKIQPDLASALRRRRADVAVLATVSTLPALAPQIRQAATLGLHVVSTCEELSFPWRKHAALSRWIDGVCRRQRVACVGTGVNPGFLMDYLPSLLTSICQDVRRVTVTRIQDASVRRIPFQQKIGAGLTRAQFRAKVKAGTLRHVGLTESMHMLAHSLNWQLDRTTETLRPVIARRRIVSGHVPIAPGLACGVEQVGRAFADGRTVIHLHFRAAVGEPESYDAVEIQGTPSFRSVIPGGIHGDVATCAITINALRSVMRASPGLHTVLDLPVPGFFA